MQQIAEQLNISYSAVRNYLKKFNIKKYKQFDISKECLTELYINQGLSANSIAAKLGVSATPILQFLKLYKLTRPGRNIINWNEFDQKIIEDYQNGISARSIGKKYNLDPSKLKINMHKIKKLDATVIDLYNKEKWTTGQIADKYKTNPGTVRQWLRQHGIQIDLNRGADIRCWKLFRDTGFRNSSQRHLTNKTLKIISNREEFIDFVHNLQDKTSANIANKLNVDVTLIYRRIDEWNLKNIIENKPKQSKEEKGIIEYIKSFYNGQIIESATKVLTPNYHGPQIDIYLPQKKLGIEYNGCVWHSLKSSAHYTPREKTNLAIKKGIRLIHIYDYEWLNYTDTFKNFLYDLIKTDKKHLIRSQEVLEINKEEFDKFCRNYHLFGNNGHSQIFYGIKNKDELVAVAGFSKARSKKYDWEWRRSCVKFRYFANFNIRELFLKKFAETHDGILVAYQQMDRFPIGTYEKSGFIKGMWRNGVVTVNSRTLKYRRHSFHPLPGLTKKETLKKRGFDLEVPTAGTIAWTVDLNNLK